MSSTAEHTAPALADMDEQVTFDGAQWYAEGPRGALWVIRWFSETGNIAAIRCPGARTGHRSTAGDLEAARAEALRLAGIIAAGKTA